MGVSGQCPVPAVFCHGERTPSTHCTGGWVGLRAGLDTEVGGKILCPCQGLNPDRLVVQSIVRHYTDRATPAPHKHHVLAKFSMFINQLSYCNCQNCPMKSKLLLNGCFFYYFFTLVKIFINICNSDWEVLSYYNYRIICFPCYISSIFPIMRCFNSVPDLNSSFYIPIAIHILFLWWGTSVTEFKMKLPCSTFQYHQMQVSASVQLMSIRYLNFLHSFNKTYFSQKYYHSIFLNINIGLNERLRTAKHFL
jgi:hypothetical protein